MRERNKREGGGGGGRELGEAKIRERERVGEKEE